MDLLASHSKDHTPLAMCFIVLLRDTQFTCNLAASEWHTRFCIWLVYAPESYLARIKMGPGRNYHKGIGETCGSFLTDTVKMITVGIISQWDFVYNVT